MIYDAIYVFGICSIEALIEKMGGVICGLAMTSFGGS